MRRRVDVYGRREAGPLRVGRAIIRSASGSPHFFAASVIGLPPILLLSSSLKGRFLSCPSGSILQRRSIDEEGYSIERRGD